MGILLRFEALGTAEDSIKGFYLYINRIKSITVNSDLPLMIQKIIVAHEIGHSVSPNSRGISTFRDLSMFEQTNSLEKEANLFAAELLLEDDEVQKELLHDGDFYCAAARLNVPAELLAFKLRIMRWKGYDIPETPVHVRSNFLKNLVIPDIDDYHVC